MRCQPVMVAILPAIVLLAVPADAAVTVAFADPTFFADATDSTGNSARPLLEIKKHFERLGDRYLQPNHSLRIEVLNVDLAGRRQTLRSMTSDVRFASGDADWPRIEVRYTLQTEAGVAAPVQETIVDMAYLRRVFEQRYISDPLRYEKRMLDNWFKARFVEHKPSG
jgi:Protein of unknown function (DUF3016)